LRVSGRAGNFQKLHELHVPVDGVLLLHPDKVEGVVAVRILPETFGPRIDEILDKLTAPVAGGVVQGGVSLLVLHRELT